MKQVKKKCDNCKIKYNELYKYFDGKREKLLCKKCYNKKQIIL